MDKQKRFRKQTLNSEDHKGMENAAKAVKGALGAAGALAMVVVNKDNLKMLGKGIASVATKVIKK